MVERTERKTGKLRENFSLQGCVSWDKQVSNYNPLMTELCIRKLNKHMLNFTTVVTTSVPKQLNCLFLH
jgi:hypothetical protein